MAPLTSEEDVANIIETNLFQRLWEAGKGEATPDARPGEIGEAELDLGRGGLRNKSFVEGGRGDSLKSVGSHKIEVKNLKERGSKINVVGGRIFSMETSSEAGQETKEAGQSTKRGELEAGLQLLGGGKVACLGEPWP